MIAFLSFRCNKMECKQLLKMIVAMCIVQLEGKESNNATWYLTYSLQQPADEKTTFEKHLNSTQNWSLGVLLTIIWASKIRWFYQHLKGESSFWKGKFLLWGV